MPMQVDKDTFRRLSGGTLHDSVFDKHAIGGLLTRDQLLELAKTTDCFLSHDWGIDSMGRDNHQRVGLVNAGLRAKGIIPWYDAEQMQGNIVSTMCNGIDKTRFVIVFVTSNYMSKVSGENMTDNCLLEFNYALRRKRPECMISVVMEPTLRNTSDWFGPVGMALGGNLYIDFSDDTLIDDVVAQIYTRIASLINNRAILEQSSTFNPTAALLKTNDKSQQDLDAAAREETQFFQWMARSTKIHESRRVVYCSSLVRDGVTSVQKLAKKMNQISNYLVKIGVNEFDADEIALSVGDLGLGYKPLKDFSNSHSVESAAYALRKASQDRNDHVLSANALMCVTRLARGNPAFPLQMIKIGFADAIVRLLTYHMGEQSVATTACQALISVAISPESIEEIGLTSACVLITKTINSHISNPTVLESALCIVGILSTSPNNRLKFGTSGACDLVVKSIGRHPSVAAVASQGCFAVCNLITNLYENVGKVGLAGGCEIIPKCLGLHTNSNVVTEYAFKIICMLSADPENRASLGNFCHESLVKATGVHIDNENVVSTSCNAMHILIIGNAHNRRLLSSSGACQCVAEIAKKYYNHQSVTLFLSKALHSLIAGSPDNKVHFVSVAPLIQNMIQNPTLHEETRREAFAALKHIL